MKVFWIVFYIFFPSIILYLAYKNKILNKIGPFILAYAVGLIIGNTNLINEEYNELPKLIATISVPFAIPLLLFSLDIKKIKILGISTILSSLFALIGVILAVISGYFIFCKHIPESWKIAGMMVGVYTGGTPNLAALKTALNVDNDIYILTHTADTLLGILMILFFLTIAQKILLFVLPKFPVNKIIKNKKNNDKSISQHQNNLKIYDDSPQAYLKAFKNYKRLPKLIIAFGLSILIVAVSYGLGQLVAKNYFEAVVILSITTLSILASLFSKIRNIKYTFQLGMYLILIFSLSVATLGKFDKLITGSVYIFYYVAWVIFISFLIHVLLSAIFRVDADSTIIITTAFTMSPPFVPVIAAALKNRYIILSGLIVGIIGYAIGNYLGLLIAYYLK